MRTYTLILTILFLGYIFFPSSTEAQSPPEPFMDVSDEAGITAIHEARWNEYSKFRAFTDGYLAMGQAWADYDNDGWVDLYVTGHDAPNVLYRNNGDGTFVESELSSIVSLPETMSGGAVWADYDNDGWKDLYVLAHGANVLFHNDEGQGFRDVTHDAGVGDIAKGTTATWGDYDGDGYLDLYVANWSCYPKCDPVDHTQAQDRLYHNQGDGTFVDVSHLLVYEKLLGAGFSATFVDYDDDRDLDIYVVNDKLHNPIGNLLWRNDGADVEQSCGGWCWTDISAEAGADTELHGMGLAVGDYDNDQDLDFFFTNMVDPNALLQNQGDGTFADQLPDSGMIDIATNAVGWGTSFFDYDNDGWLDIYYGTTEFIKFNEHEGPLGMMFQFPNFLFHNEGGTSIDRPFLDATPASWIENPIPTMGFAYADYDQDGWLDFVQGNWNQGYRLYHNRGLVGQRNHWISLRLVGGGTVNRDAIGARVYITTNDGRKLMQEVKSGSALGSGNDTTLHFGLGQASVLQALVLWPDGLKQLITTIPRDRIFPILHPKAVAAGVQLPTNAEPFADVSQQAGITAKHEGTWRMFKPDFTTGYLGVGQAWGDYDNDGWVDLYVTGNQAPNVLYHNNQDGTFSESPLSSNVSLPDLWSGGAIWADYDNDGWRDLYVLAHGANVLFRNDEGEGFTDVTELAGVGDPGKGSTATWGDYDNDGYLDLYVTNWACHPECDPLDFNQSRDTLYHNNGDGTFRDVTDLLTYPQLLGAGFTASFVDFDGDRDLDIYVVNDALLNPIGNVLWRNDGPDQDGTCGGWCWSDASKETGAGIVIEGMGLAVGDYDNDLDLDLYFSNMVNPSALMQNQGDGTFLEIAKTAGVEAGPGATVGWGTVFFDYDNDGWLDLYMSTTEFRNLDRDTPPDGMHFDHPNFLYHNERDGTFSNQSPNSWLINPRRSMGIAYADYDQDGRIDFVTGDWGRGYTLYQNQDLGGSTHNWLTIRLEGGEGVNRDAVGTQVLLKTNDGRTQMQTVVSGSSLGAGNDTALHFGLGESTVDWVTVLWPNGSVSLYKSVPVNRVWHVEFSAS